MSEGQSSVISWWDALANMPVGRASLFSMIFTDTIGTGSLVIFVLWPGLLATLDISKLLLLSFAITAPFIAFATFMLQGAHALKNETALHEGLGPRIADSIGTHCMWSLLSLLVIGLQSTFPLPVGPPLDRTFAFWSYMAFYVYAMGLRAAVVRFENRRIMLLMFVPLVLFALWRIHLLAR